MRVSAGQPSRYAWSLPGAAAVPSSGVTPPAPDATCAAADAAGCGAGATADGADAADGAPVAWSGALGAVDALAAAIGADAAFVVCGFDAASACGFPGAGLRAEARTADGFFVSGSITIVLGACCEDPALASAAFVAEIRGGVAGAISRVSIGATISVISFGCRHSLSSQASAAQCTSSTAAVSTAIVLPTPLCRATSAPARRHSAP